MGGERSARLVDIAARASARVVRRLELINEYYAPPTPLSEVRDLTFERYMEHYDEFGHWAPHAGCNHPVCQEASQLIQMALTSFQAMQTAPQAEAPA